MFHLFRGYHYYPCSGLGDYVDSFPTLTDALIAEEEHHRQENNIDWYTIITTDDHGRLIEEVRHKY